MDLPKLIFFLLHIIFRVHCLTYQLSGAHSLSHGLRSINQSETSKTRLSNLSFSANSFENRTSSGGHPNTSIIFISSQPSSLILLPSLLQPKQGNNSANIPDISSKSPNLNKTGERSNLFLNVSEDIKNNFNQTNGILKNALENKTNHSSFPALSQSKIGKQLNFSDSNRISFSNSKSETDTKDSNGSVMNKEIIKHKGNMSLLLNIKNISGSFNQTSVSVKERMEELEKEKEQNKKVNQIGEFKRTNANNTVLKTQNISVYSNTNDQKSKTRKNTFQPIVIQDRSPKIIQKTGDTRLQKLTGPPNLISFTLALPYKKNEASISNLDQFPGISLFSQVPLTFTVGQVYKFKGSIKNHSVLKQQKNYLNIVFMSTKNKSEFRCVQPILSGQTGFEISCRLLEPGTFYLFMFATQNGISSKRIRKIYERNKQIPHSHSLIEGPKAYNISFDVVNNDFYIKWESVAPITNLTIYQKQGLQIRKRQFLLSNYHSKFSLDFRQFSNFQPKLTFVQISHAGSYDGTINQISSQFSQPMKAQFIATFHAFQKDQTDQISINQSIPWKVDIGATITLQGTFRQDFKNEALIILPNKKIVKVLFLKSSEKSPPIDKIEAHTKVSLQIAFPEEGIYILEINNMEGLALINRPFYAGNVYPLLPDFIDVSDFRFSLTPQKRKKTLEEYMSKKLVSSAVIQPEKYSSIEAKRFFFLTLLNFLRKSYDLQPLVLDERLNQIAQMHSEDMKENNFFGHTNLRGQGPRQRAINMNFSNSIGENVAIACTLIQAHLQLQRSAAHLENSIKQIWRRVGIGISINTIGKYLVTVNFSIRDYWSNPLSYNEIETAEKQIGYVIKEKNGNMRLTNELSEQIKNWMKQKPKVNVLQYLIKVKKIKGQLSGSNFLVSFSRDIGERFRKSNLFSGSKNFKQFGLAIFPNSLQPHLLEGFVVFRA